LPGQKVCHSPGNPENPRVTALTQLIQAEIAAAGPITFARFMELALYHPGLGYYETSRHQVGFKGDFYTSVSTGELFGQLLAFRFANWLQALPPTEPEVWLIEAGAHDGQLARDILDWLRAHRPELYARLHYGIIDPSPQRQAWQREKLGEFGDRVRWFDNLAALRLHSSSVLPSPPVRVNREVHLAGSTVVVQDAAPPDRSWTLNGIIFSNELLDAMPVHRLGWDARRQNWFEWGVTWDGDKCAWTQLPAESHQTPTGLDLPGELLAVLPDGYTIEVSPAAADWWREAAEVLKGGKLMAIDYGFTREEMITPGRFHGTVRAYFRHQYCGDLLANPGEQDLTAHVNFSAIQATGERAGLLTESYLTQPQFLTAILAEALKDPGFGEWTARRTRQFQTLTHPQHLGRAFKVLIQGVTFSPPVPASPRR
jgi:SAM-dependent MidA family methyltransferase